MKFDELTWQSKKNLVAKISLELDNKRFRNIFLDLSTLSKVNDKLYQSNFLASYFYMTFGVCLTTVSFESDNQGRSLPGYGGSPHPTP